MWLLGSSDYSARLAASRGLPYVFAHHFSGQGTAEALALYRDDLPARPMRRRAAHLPHRQRVRGRDRGGGATGWRGRSCSRWWRCAPAAPLTPQLTVEEAAEVALPPEHEDLARAMRERWVVGSPETARPPRSTSSRSDFAVDEVMVHPVAGSSTGTDPRRSPAREATLELLARAAVPR